MPTLVFLTQIISGHSNVHFAILRRLLALPASEAPAHIHIIGDEPLRKRVAGLPASAHTRVTFHPLDATDAMGPAVSDMAVLRGPPLSPSLSGLRILQRALTYTLWLPKDVYLRRYARMVSVLQDVKPDLVVVDILQGPVGRDACHKLGLRYVIEAPISSLDLSRLTQPGGRGFWKYPATFTSARYPVPLWEIPYNILTALTFILFLVFHPAGRALEAVRKEAGLAGSALTPLEEGSLGVIVASLPEIEFPHVPLPRTVFAGPILTPVSALAADEHADLAAFLALGRTALINMGSLFLYTADDVIAVADAIVGARTRLQDRGGLRVLWKLPRASAFAALLDEKLDPTTERRKWVRVEEWIDPPALAVLQHTNVVVSVHHGGANSVHEATYAGVPQIVLPQWLDCYNFAARVETLGHGIFGNRNAEATIDATQLADALVRVCSDRAGEPGAALKARADELGRICRAAKGDERAAGAILAAARGESLEGWCA